MIGFLILGVFVLLFDSGELMGYFLIMLLVYVVYFIMVVDSLLMVFLNVVYFSEYLVFV